MAGRKWPPLEERLWARVDKGASPDDCWLWTGHKVSGYGRIYGGGRTHHTHRLVYELLVGPIPEGLHIDHLCRNPPCCNPAHLEPVTREENVRRGFAWKRENNPTPPKMFCKRGHALAGDNLYVQPNNGKRACRTCRIAATKASDARRRGKRAS